MKIIWPLILISYASLFVFGLSDNIRGPLFPEILKEFNVSDSMGSLMFALSSLSGFMASHFARHVLRIFDRRSILQCACLGMTLALIGLSLAPHFYVFLALSVLFGVTSGIIGLIPNVLVPLGSSPEKKTTTLIRASCDVWYRKFTGPNASRSSQSAEWKLATHFRPRGDCSF